MLNEKTLNKVISRVVTAAHPLKVILFGSVARGNADEDSDIDLLVIEECVENKGKEMVRLRNVIGSVGVGVDILVYSKKEVTEKGHLPGTALYSALKKGKVVYERP